ncbi:MAG: hypothetical protein DRR08_06270 [Candidatus Parabeggiatoa sp. nov. 2]|jgi:hypothetical protein|nr:MAG: hypothetical protein B6247_24285 [Beggiatoa sp. 4572_84]RKZ62345.1 MAG: hypothetical protein DRR08_06270 [Gammaproteobacteria bacterium]
MEFNKRELRTIMGALKLQIETYRKIESQDDKEALAEVIMDRGYTESLLSAVEEYYNQLNHPFFEVSSLRQSVATGKAYL